MRNIDQKFKNLFPNIEFQLKPFQKQVIDNTVWNDNTLCIMPTGGGKSVIYWMSAVMMQGITIVVSPLTALIAEQSIKIQEQGYSVMELHGNVDAKKQMDMLKKIANKEYTPDFIFVSPEKIATDGLLEYCLKERRDDIHLMVIDEVHCVSQWGINFRPLYKRIPAFMNSLFGENSWCRILAMTATLNPREISDICSAFHISRHNIIRDEMLMRSEIQLHTMKLFKETDKEAKLWDLIRAHKDEKILVYVYRKYGDRGVEGLSEQANIRGYKAECFHGDMSPKERMEIIDQYRNGTINLVFATSAFGMGVDIPDIRVVIHYMIPESAEQYYQEIGRAARDGHAANAYLLYSNKNIEVKRKNFIDRAFPNEEKFRQVFAKISNKAGYKVVPYFEDEELQECLPYFLEAGLVELVGKGFSDLSDISDIKDKKIQDFYDSTKTKGYCMTLKRCNVMPKELSSSVYKAIIEDQVKVLKPLSRWVVLDIKSTDINDESLARMLEMADEKRRYKHELFDYFLFILENNPNSIHLHQEIELYLGMDKHQLNRIHETLDGNYVRSKSEVIISNMLFEAGIKYVYEQKLFYGDGQWIEPDFTIELSSGKKIFWEHVGMLGNEEYDANWMRKLDIYERYFPGEMVKTYESGSISKDAKNLIDSFSKL